MSGIPAIFTRENGESFWGGYQNRTDLHYADGWRDELKPEIDFSCQNYGQPYYDPSLDKVVYPVEEIPFDLAAKKASLFGELEIVQDDFERLISRCERIHGKENAGLNSAIAMVLAEQSRVANDIRNLDATTGRTYAIRPEDVEALRALFDNYKF